MKHFRTGTRIYVQDNMQSGYAYDLTCNPGEHFAPDFQPELTPAQMLARGVFEEFQAAPGGLSIEERVRRILTKEEFEREYGQ